MAMYLRPHSEEWFKALECSNAGQAHQTKAAIEKTGNRDICGMCGARPARDYKMIGSDLPKYAVATVRLCEDCHHIRRNSGENFAPFP